MSVNVVSPSTGALSPIASRGQFIQYSVMPTPSVDILNKIVQYIGTTTANYTNGYFYKCIYDESVSPAIYRWENVQVQSASGGSAVDSVNGKTGTVILDAKDIGFQVDTMPTAESAIVNQIVQYTGTTTANYTNGYFYKCITDGSTYSWTNIEVQTSGASSDNVVEGYFNSTDNLFYEESTYITPIMGANNVIYISLDTDLLYRYNGSIFIRVDKVDISDKADKVTSATNGDLASLNASGNLVDSGIASTDVVIKSATEGLIKNDGTIDTNTYLTEDDITDKADKVTSATNGDLAGLDGNGNLTDSGILATNVIQKSATSGLVKNDGTIDESDYLTASDVTDKADKVDNATNGDLAGLDANGNLTDSGVLASNVLVKSNTVGLVKNDGTIDTNSYATTTQLADKTDKVANATADDLATLDANGNLTDSGINKNIIPNTATSSNKLATNNDLPTELNDLSDDVVITSPTNGQILKYNATSSKWENQTEQPPVSGATFKGSILFANIPTTGMENGDWYDIKDAFTTDSRFEEGAGIECTAGTDIIWVTDDSKWNILTPSGVNSFNGRVGAVVPASGDYDASDIDYDNTTSGLTATDVQDAIDEVNTNVNGKANKVSGATNGNFASLDANGNLADSGSKASDFSTVKTRQTPASGGTDLSLVNTGDMYTWNNKSTVSIANSGTASGTTYSQQNITINGTANPINGTRYMELTQNIQSANVFTFSNGTITTSSVIDYYTSDFSVQPSNVSVVAGQCVVTVPKASSSKSLTVRIYIK